VRLLYVAPSVDPAQGGVAEAVRSLGVAQKQLGHWIEVATLDAPDAPHVIDFELPIHALGPGWKSYGYRSDFVPRLRALAARFDAVIVNGLWQYSTLGAWRALRGTRTPYYVFPHGMLDPWFRRAYPAKHAKKWLYWLLAEQFVLRRARAVLFTAEEERLLARRTFPFYRCREEMVGLGCVEPELNPKRQTAAFFGAHPELRGRRLILFLGRLHSKKGCDLLIRAFGYLQTFRPVEDVTLVMAGPSSDDAYLQQLQQIAAETCRDGTVVFPGMLSGDLKWGAFQAAECFVLPSHQENFGVAVAEALACSRPVLISRGVNIWREIEADGAGIVDADTLAGTTRLLERWEDTPPTFREAMSAVARRTFEQRFEITRAAQRMISLLEADAEIAGK
jgi:glycosyltransferase involved in cell wall biosynthesis